MRYLFVAPELTAPTFETLQEYSIQKLAKLERLFKNIRKSEVNIRISVTKEKNQFCVVAEVYLSHLRKEIIVKEKDTDLRRSIDKVASQLKNNIVKNKEKKFRSLRSEKRNGKIAFLS